MTDLTDLLVRATGDLAPGAPDTLLLRACEQGDRLRRRRRAGRAAGATALVVAAVSGVIALGSQPGTSTREAPTSGINSLSDSPSPPTSGPPARPALLVDRTAIGATFARVVPGSITDEHDVPAGRVHSRGAYESDFDWNGYRAAMQLVPFDGDARSACERGLDQDVTTIRCVRVPGGWAVRDAQMDDKSYSRWANVYRDDHWQMWVMINNAGSEKGTATGGPPPLDVPDLERVATSGLWFG